MTINVIDETGEVPSTFIKSIYDPGQSDDYRYVAYDTSKSVKFSDVTPGSFRAHACPIGSYAMGNYVDFTLNKGDNYVITFTCTDYYSGNYYWVHTIEK